MKTKAKRILIVENDEDLREALKETLDASDYDVVYVANGMDALAELSIKAYDLVITDVQMPGMDGYSLLLNIKQKYFDTPVILMTAYATIEQAIDAIRAGANEYLVKPFDADSLYHVIEKYLKNYNLQEASYIAEDEQSKKIFQLAKRVSNSDVSVLISGESGTGKEVLAKYIHAQSSRADNKFIAINCAAIPENMLEAELFGYEKGAYTGAVNQYQGKFEQAQKGTLLLDEISEMSLTLQAKLLRVLQEKELQRLGGKHIIKLDVRVIATTNRNLNDEVRHNRFREDLFYRLNVFPVTMMPLSQRQEDILPLANIMLSKYKQHLCAASTEDIGLTLEAELKLLNYAWPGNVRELENVIQRAMVVCDGEMITEYDLYFEHNAEPQCENGIPDMQRSSLMTDMKQHERETIIKTLQGCNGSRKTAAKKLGISPRTLRYKLSKMKEQGIKVPEVCRIA